MEEFISHSSALLAARPDTAKITMRYTHKKMPLKSVNGERVDDAMKPARFVFRAYCPRSGISYKYTAKRTNELSRLLATLSPQMYETGTTKKRGISSVLADVVFDDEQAKNAESEGKKKKKGKKH